MAFQREQWDWNVAQANAAAAAAASEGSSYTPRPNPNPGNEETPPEANKSSLDRVNDYLKSKGKPQVQQYNVRFTAPDLLN